LSASFAAITKTGKGSKVVKFTIPTDTAAIATISNRGSANFIVESLAADGDTNELLVNKIGNYAGTVLFDTESSVHSVAFKIQSNGSWKVVIKPVTSARAWNGTGRLSGKADDVVRLTPMSSGLTTVTLVHSGRANFIGTAYGTDGRELLANEIGRYSGQTTLPEGTFLFQVEADGAWTITSD